MPGGRRISWDAGNWTASALALGGLSWVLAAGRWTPRLGPVVGFVTLWFALATVVLVVKWATLRRATRLQAVAIPQSVRLCQPIWMKTTDLQEWAAVGAAVGALTAAVGFPGIGVGVLLMLAVLGCVPLLAFVGDDALTFEPGGLRVHQRWGAFLVPWVSIVDVTSHKTPGKQFTNVRVADPVAIIASASPDNERNRSRVWTALYLGTPRGQALCFFEWTAGFDTVTLTRALREAMGARSRAAN